MNSLTVLILDSDNHHPALSSNTASLGLMAEQLYEAGHVPITVFALEHSLPNLAGVPEAAGENVSSASEILVRRFLPHCDAIVVNDPSDHQDWRIGLASSLHIPIVSPTDVHRLIGTAASGAVRLKAA